MNKVSNLSRIVGQAARLPSLGRRGIRPVPNVVGRGGSPRRFVAAWLLASSLTVFTIACSTTGPRVLEVSSRTRLQDVDPVDKDLFIYDEASRMIYEPQDLSIDAQREEFYVRWTPATVSLVKFQYRQIAKPDTIFEKTYTTHGDLAHLFQVRGEEFRTGGAVSAWRVSLWNGDQLAAEKMSFLW